MEGRVLTLDSFQKSSGKFDRYKRIRDGQDQKKSDDDSHGKILCYDPLPIVLDATPELA